jgi:HPt (histidine-containing phosphotransfer) domain-containing protein
MLALMSVAAVDTVAAPSLSRADSPIDLTHLARMTLGDASLEREVLQLFDRQADMLMTRMADARPALVAASAHTLKGSARGIGAWRIARDAETVELAAASAEESDLKIAKARLEVSIGEAKTAIAELLRAH